jgi:hypothetical protein
VQEKEWRIRYNQELCQLHQILSEQSQQQGFSRKGTYREWAKIEYPEESQIPNLKEAGQWGDLNLGDGWCGVRLVDTGYPKMVDGHQGQPVWDVGYTGSLGSLRPVVLLMILTKTHTNLNFLKVIICYYSYIWVVQLIRGVIPL